MERREIHRSKVCLHPNIPQCFRVRIDILLRYVTCLTEQDQIIWIFNVLVTSFCSACTYVPFWVLFECQVLIPVSTLRYYKKRALKMESCICKTHATTGWVLMFIYLFTHKLPKLYILFDTAFCFKMWFNNLRFFSSFVLK